MRHEFQRMMGRYKQEIGGDRPQGRRLLSQAHIQPDITLEVFFMDEPLPGFGALSSSRRPKQRPAEDPDFG